MRVARETIARQAISKGIDRRASESTEAIEEGLLRYNFLDDNDIISTRHQAKGYISTTKPLKNIGIGIRRDPSFQETKAGVWN
jgi:hypothetical protein